MASDRSSASRGRRSGGDRRSSRGRSGGKQPPPPRKPWSPEAGRLPTWVADEIARSTPKPKVRNAMDELMAAADAFASGKHGKAMRHAERAKELSPRAASIREILALSAYRTSRWDIALRELRTFRRLTGEATHIPVEMDVLRALDRPDDVESAWGLLRRLDARKEIRDEGKVVYGSFLLDRGEDRKAWEVTNPKRIHDDPRESDLRVWYVAARAAARLGDHATGRRLYEAIQSADPGFPGLDELDAATRG
ncbi:MAG: hypothetical protein R3290_04235 [Acidimicrobiia bacterium]|nr:hypothetical protein [Acidimicrobiia bacterium]